MGYSASGSGDATLKKGCTKEQVLKALEEMDLGEIEMGFFNDHDGNTCIDFSESDTHWHEEDTYAFLNAIAPFISGGYASYSGEDDCIWRYKFNPDEKKWDEESAHIDFNFESYSDKELIEELEKRGYKVEAVVSKPKYGVKVTYSWGDEEDPDCYDKFDTPEEAYQELCRLAAKEAYVQNEEFLPENTCQISFNAAEKKVDLHYDYDDSYCYYSVIEIKPDEDDNKENEADE